MDLYMIELDILERVKLLLQNGKAEEGLKTLKTNGECILQYTSEEYKELLEKIGENKADTLNQRFLGLMDIRGLYDSVKLDNEDIQIRDFKLKIYPAITECKGIVVLQSDNQQAKQEKKWYEFWK